MRQIILILTTAALIHLLGCSGGDRIVTPDEQSLSSGSNLEISSMPVGVSDRFIDGTPSNGTGILGIFELNLDKEKLSAELLPLRKSALEDTLEVVDITNFLTMAPCTECVNVNSVSIDPTGNLVVSIGIKHPFDAGDPLKPISGRNRGDLHVFNVEGLIVSDSTVTSFTGIGPSVADFILVNADGMSGYLDTSLDDIYPTDATIHPYILHFDDYTIGNFDPLNPMGFLSVTDPPPSGNLVMAMGCDYDFQDYIFDLSSGDISFIYAVGCTYAVSSASKAQRFSPEYRIPQHNKKAASEVLVEIISNDLKGEDILSDANLSVKVLDMNDGAVTGIALDEMLADSSVGSISVEIPNVTASPVIVPSPIPTGGDGRDPLNPLTYDVAVTNTGGAVEGTYLGLVKVTDTYAPGQNASPLLAGMDGIKRVDPIVNPLDGLFSISEFATYAIFSIDVASSVSLPTACFTTDPAGTPDVDVPVCETVEFDASCSTDSSAVILYEWDFDWDGIPANFIDDTSGTNQHLINRFFGVEGNFEVALRVTNDQIPAQSDIASINVVVTGLGNPDITDSDTTVVNLDRRYFIDMIGVYENWVYVLNKGTYNGDAGMWLYASCSMGDGWLDPVQISTNSSDDSPQSCALDITSDGRPVVAWLDSDDDACIAIADDSTAQTWSARQEVFSSAIDLRNIDVACNPSNQDNAVIAFTRYDVPSGNPQRIYSFYTNNLTGGSPSWTACRDNGGYWTIWAVQDVNSEFTTDGEFDQVVWRLWPTSTIGNMVYHRRWTPGGTYGIWSACCGYVSPNISPYRARIKSSPDLLVDSMNRPVVAYAEAENRSSGTPLPPWRLFISQGTDASRPLFPIFPEEVTINSNGNVDKPSIAEDPDTGDYWIVYNYYDTDPAEPSQIMRAIVDSSLNVLSFDTLWNDNDAANAYDDKYPHIIYTSYGGVKRMITIWFSDESYPRIHHKITDL